MSRKGECDCGKECDAVRAERDRLLLLVKTNAEDLARLENERDALKAELTQMDTGRKACEVEIDRLRAQLKVMKEALQETLAALVSYKKYVPEPYKQNPIYIIGAHEAEVKAISALSQLEGEK